MIDVSNIKFSYPGQSSLVFNDFSLRLEQNRIYGLLGKNGTGKSTLLYLIAGLLRPGRGTVTVDGAPATERRAEMLSEIFLVPEEFDLPKCRLNEYVRLNRTFYPRFSDDILSSCLSEFGLPENPNLQELSMGQKKKVFMSFALATCTKYLLMDEPTNGLDIPSKSQFRKVVAQSMTEDRTLIISTHQVHDVEQLLDHILILTQQSSAHGCLNGGDTAEVRLRLSHAGRDGLDGHLCRAVAAGQRRDSTPTGGPARDADKSGAALQRRSSGQIKLNDCNNKVTNITHQTKPRR